MCLSQSGVLCHRRSMEQSCDSCHSLIRHRKSGTGPVTAFYIRGCQEKKLLPRLEEAKKFFLASSPCIEVRIRDCSVSPDSSRWRDDVVRFMTQQAVRLSGGNHG